MSIRQIPSGDIEKTVKRLCMEANTVLRPDVLEALKEAYRQEQEGTLARNMLKILLDNARIAKEENMPICQDTGMVAVFIDIGKEVVVTDGNLADAVNKGMEEAYEEEESSAL